MEAEKKTMTFEEEGYFSAELDDRLEEYNNEESKEEKDDRELYIYISRGKDGDGKHYAAHGRCLKRSTCALLKRKYPDDLRRSKTFLYCTECGKNLFE